ncbi:hypothetical protein BASA82_000066 [Batrachochytrium salamandrivorans]|nr:hypothetical protein BASA82_000066 [Batrachochytrium salamandrivorans]
MQLPRSWFKITSKACVRRPSRAQASEDDDEEEEEESYLHVQGRIFIAPQALWFNSNFADTHCVPLEPSPFPTSTPSPMQLVSDEDFKLLSATVGILDSCALVLLPSTLPAQALTLKRGSFYIVPYQPMLCIQHHNQANYFGLTHREYALLERLNDSSANSFLLHAAVGLLHLQSTQQRTQMQSELGPSSSSTSASLEGLRKSLLFPADNEVFHFGVLKKRNKNVGLTAKYVWLTLGRLVSVTAEAGGSSGVVKSVSLTGSKSRVLGEKIFECVVRNGSTLTFTSEDKLERDVWIRNIQLCALFESNEGNKIPLVGLQTAAEVTQFIGPQVVMVEDLLDALGRGRGELDPNWRQSTLDFERDRVVVNSSEVLPCVMSEIIAKMAREIGQIANESGDASSHHLKFIWTILLAANRTQCGGVIYETLQQMFRSTPAMQDQFLISPKSEQVLPLNITLGRAYSELSTSMEPLQLPPLPSPRSGSELETTTMVKSASDSLPPKRGHRRSSSDPQFFKKMMPKYPQPVQTTNLTRTSSLSPSLGQPQQPPVALDSPKKSPLTMGRRLPPPPASASAYFKHQRTFSLQKKHHHPAELEFQHFDALPGNSVRACVVATMDFVVRDCDTNEPVLCVQCVYTREFFLVDGKSLAKDQGQVSVCLLEEEEEVGGEAEEEVVGEDKLNLTSLVTEVDEEDDCGSVVFLSGEEEEEEEELEEVL